MTTTNVNAQMTQISYSVEELKIIETIRQELLTGDLLTQDHPMARRFGACVAEIMQKIPADYNSAEGRAVLSLAVSFLFKPVNSSREIDFFKTPAKTLDSASSPTEP
jgi:hypothetical protein